MKFADGGYIPLLLAAAVFSVMWIWHHGSEALARRLQKSATRVEVFEAKAINTARVPGTAVTRADREVPPCPAVASRAEPRAPQRDHRADRPHRVGALDRR